PQYLRHRQPPLHRRVPIGGHYLELLHSSLRFHLVWFLHSDSPFSRQKEIALGLSRLRGVATVYDQSGIPDAKRSRRTRKGSNRESGRWPGPRYTPFRWSPQPRRVGIPARRHWLGHYLRRSPQFHFLLLW